MKRSLLPVVSSLLIALSSLMALPVLAQATSTPQPTHTLYPTFYPTITPITYDFPDVFECPVNGTPIVGFGTVTPDAFWQASCGKCVVTPMMTSTGQATVSPAPGSPTSVFATLFANSPTPGTPAPGGATSTPTNVPGNYITLPSGACNAGLQCDQISNTAWHFTVMVSNGIPIQTIGLNLAGNSNLYFLFKTVDTNWSASNSSQASSPAWLSKVGLIQYGDPYSQSISWLSDGELQSGNPANNTGLYYGTGSADWFERTIYMPFPGYTQWQVGLLDSVQFNSVPSIDRAGLEWWVSLQPLFAPATPTPGASSYCASVNGGASDMGSDPALTWSGVRYGYNACVDIGGWEFSVLGLDVSIPLIGLCMQDVSFANVVFFGMTLALDAILYVLVGAWALRRMFTS